ncbi:MAG: hypothetical protein CMC72_03560 [Flavobacteriaceae bacterium]|nr:hypothetical protein [Flavobacteriaceae bacterium]
MEIIIICLVTFSAAILTFFSGFGLGTILTPVMLIFFPVEIAIAFTGIIHFSNNIFKLFIVSKSINSEVLIKFGGPAILASFAGLYLLFNINGAEIFYSIFLFGEQRNVTIIKFLVSVLLIIFSLLDLLPFLKNLKFDKKTLPIGGFLSGFFGGLTGNQGALRSAFLIKMDLNKNVFISTTVVISTLVDFTRIGVYSTNLLKVDMSEYFVMGLFSVISGALGSIIGNQLLKKITIETIRSIVAFLILTLASCLLIGII